MPKRIHVSMGVDHPLYCPFCGTKTLAQNGKGIEKENICEHLMFTAMNEVGLTWCRKDLKKKLSKVDFNSDLSIARLKIDTVYSDCCTIDNSFIFEISEPYGMNGMAVLVGYEKKREEEKDMQCDDEGNIVKK